MKAIEIRIEGVDIALHSVVASLDTRNKLSYISKKMERFIRAQAIDGEIYCGDYAVRHRSDATGGGCASDCVFAHNDGSVARYYIKRETENSATKASDYETELEAWVLGTWTWRAVELRLIDVMDGK